MASLGHQSLPPTNLGRIDEEMASPETHPDLYKEFKQSCFFGIKQATKPFSRQPMYLVLEQTINAGAARSLTGVIHLNSISARHWWARYYDVRSTIINLVYLELGLPTHQDVSTDLNLHITRKNTKQLRQYIATFDQFINPVCLEKCSKTN
ncbi:uncharacterized protein TNCV_2446881 [Trichonephila clavipes]|nr:uncharacterized protein TNCV_2446881 [Trichonephila clavipes]